MREEIEAAALFITRLVNKNLSNGAGSTSSSIHSHSSSASSSLSSSSSSSSASSTSSDGPGEFDEHQQKETAAVTSNGDQCKVERFRQCLEEALYERFNNHWFPEQPTKGQAYRCIRLNEWDRRDITLQKACSQCGIDYKDLQLPVELTLWVDPDEVTCRFGETKGSHCLVAKFKDGELKVEQDNLNLDINNIDIEIFRQAAANEGMRQQAILHGSPDYKHNRPSMNGTSGHNNSYQYNHHQNNSGHQHHQQQNHQSQHHHQQQSSPHHNHHQHHQSPHRANIGKTAMFPTYHQGYSNGCDTNGNPIPYYYF